ncbi:guanine deaminase [Methylobacterium sp. 4-46]|uniref:guanine deaminase n=1 Tax=unclassified Methylobacterium TaxID=2615210 RepID=UPI000152C07F|nr:MULTISPECIES: guanine deaminase [Methylobacterium]ACA17062.1 guanine deaminase [Methylobacterium sp. 4-46]WFT82750.1 guanine deaminase [Methylobacterium nodulans]
MPPEPRPRRAALRGQAISFSGNPFLQAPRDCFVHHEDALILIEDGRIAAFAPYDPALLPPGVTPVHYENALITAGFVDAHVHYPQVGMVGAFGEQLLAWLERYTFPAERAFADPAHAEAAARIFLREILRAGTTTASVYCTVHPHSVDALFAESERFNTLMVAGKVLMDSHAPDDLRDTVESGYEDSLALIRRWHGRGRQHYGVTPRYAGSCSAAQLDSAGALLRGHEGLFLQTHLSESPAEVAWVRDLFPARSSYLDIYAHAGLVRPRAIFGHGIHVGEEEFCTCHAAGAALAHCPTSNLFLGSGLFRLFDALDPRRPVRVAIGTDIGAGTSFSALRTLGEAYKVAALRGDALDGLRAFHLATLGGAAALHLDDRIGRIAPGYDADLCVLGLDATPFLAFRTARCERVEDLMFVLMTLGDERAVRATWVAGECVYDAARRPDPFRYVDGAAAG